MSNIKEHNKGENAVEVRKALVGEEKVKVGDWVMVQMGIIVRVLSKKEAKEMLEGWV